MTTPADTLDPVLLHHIVNTLGWSDLRPLQRDAIAPLLAGHDALLLAPTAGGKTEAALFPLLTRMAAERWLGTGVLYLCPLKALLNNLEPRVSAYAQWLGRAAALWHGDVTAPRRRSVLAARPDILLTTPESLESMLVSVNVDHRAFLGSVRAVVVDEVHAFAGDDRGWHLLALLERLTRIVGRPIQRIGLSATIGNPDALLDWLQGSSKGQQTARVVSPPAALVSTVDIELDHVGSLENAALVIASLHAGQKRLVFGPSRRAVEELGQLLRTRHVTTFLSHASLSVDERRRAEQAFGEARDCVIVSTSTLELGIDVGDLDRVIQIDAPLTVSAFLQRLGRTGRRPGGRRNCLFLTTNQDSLLTAAALLTLWSRGFVEPVTAPPEPRHIVAQQLLALCLQQGTVGLRDWPEGWNGLEPFGRSAEVIVRYLIEHGFLDVDGGLMFVGPEAEKQFGRRHFMGMTAVFTGAPEFTVLHGRDEIGRVDPSVLIDEVPGERRILLAGRSWTVTYIDWTRRRCFVERADSGGKARWMTGGLESMSFPLARAARDVLLGTDPPVTLTRRAVDGLREIRDSSAMLAHPGGTVVLRDARQQLYWWTFAGYRANATLTSTLRAVTDPIQPYDDYRIRLRDNVTPAEWRALLATARTQLTLPDPSPKALAGLKFNAALPDRLATATLAARLADLDSALTVLAEPTRFTTLAN
jgi:ATP-dependent helicase Lhr and Lhr-like helicase